MGQYISKFLSPSPGLPDATSQSLGLAHPTDTENKTIWTLTSTEWKDALTVPQYMEESVYLTTVPLARNQGMTQWILVEKHLPPDQRTILASCESFRKYSLTSDPEGKASESITHGIASVYCNPAYRGRGYASRMLKELGEVILPAWQTEERKKCIAAVLYSDIGGDFYERLGWHPVPSHHIAFDPAEVESPGDVALVPLFAGDLDAVCELDERIVRAVMETPTLPQSRKMRFTIVPDADHMRWHHSKEEFACWRLFGRSPEVKGVMAGRPGSRVWVIWTHRFYEHPDTASGNTLYILRLGLESQASEDAKGSVNAEVQNLKLVLDAARAEAAEWNLNQIQMWDPSPHVAGWVKRTGIPYRAEERTEESLGCLRWYGGGGEDAVEWVYNEKYAWC